jgi:hypothetical protein
MHWLRRLSPLLPSARGVVAVRLKNHSLAENINGADGTGYSTSQQTDFRSISGAASPTQITIIGALLTRLAVFHLKVKSPIY